MNSLVRSQQFGTKRSSNFLMWGVFFASAIVASNLILDKVNDITDMDEPFYQSNYSRAGAS